ncbi:hypothetical protein WAK64_20180 [Bacillus spongiae]|uniref:Uncharacterized protein n=1 Tax=Bacillus spongiae TaxID=2683610 RepID=A0ABU8HJ32_9BACI
MDRHELRELRKYQYFMLNSSYLIGLGILFGTVYLGSSLKVLFIIALFFSLFQLVFFLYKKEPFTFFSKKQKRILEYEKEKLGAEEWKKQQRVQFISIIVLILVLAYNANTLTEFDWIWLQETDFFVFITVTSLLLGILLNLTTMIRNRKLDRMDQYSLKGFTVNQLVIAVAIAMMFSFGMMWFIISLVMR